MTPLTALPLVVTWIVVLVAPGPDVLMILQQAAPRDADRDRAASDGHAPAENAPNPRILGLWSALGVMTGNFLWMMGAVIGLGALIALFPAIVPILKILGGAFLTYVGLSGLWALRGASRGGPRVKVRRASPRRAYLKGLATNLSNPKALVFFSAMLAPFMSHGYPWWQTAILVLVFMAIGLAWFSMFAWIASSAVVVRWVRAYWFRVEVVTTCLFAVIGIVFIVDGLWGLKG
ncbi:LysE family translocator [Kocuria massiliensis]|uniref:LysE family translocator n=1 Tax=Kocuria massiliensis TaxID=1926282 RepID=UPI0022B9BD4A|nr:LysE family translocator [Kocuria massiliensis]